MILSLLLAVGCPEKTGESIEACLVCPTDLAVECEGEYTAIDLPDPTGCVTSALQTDVPGEGFAVGASEAAFWDGDQSCASQIMVTDTVSPVVSCAEELWLPWTVVEDPPSVPVSEVADACDPAPHTEVSVNALERGANVVLYEAWDAEGNPASCTSEITVQELFPAEDLQVLSAGVAAEGTRVVLGWSPSPGSDTAELRLETAEDADGPWSPVATLPVETLTYDLTIDASTLFRLTSLSAELEGGSTETLEVFPVAEAAYDERNVEVATVPFPTTLYGVVRYPLGEGPFPVILLLHGNHGNCRSGEWDYCGDSEDHECPWDDWETTPNAEGMVFQAETLAAQGYVTVSISGNAMNCRDDYILERAELIIEHLRHLQDWNESDGGPLGLALAGALDLSNTGLIGHSRGGDAVSHVPEMLQNSPEPGIGVTSVFAIAPTDFFTARVLDTHYAVLLPACDGDVSSLVGRQIYDRSVQDDGGVRLAQAFYLGANHNFFSTEWADNDGLWVCDAGVLVGQSAQQGWLEATLGPWFKTTIQGAPLRPDMRAEGQVPAAVAQWSGTPVEVRWSYSSDVRLPIDYMEGPDAPDLNLLGEPNSFEGFLGARSCGPFTCGGAYEHLQSALVLKWSEDLATARFGLGGLDVGDFRAFSFRISTRRTDWNDARDAHDAWLVLQDVDGQAGTLRLSDLQRVAAGYEASQITDMLQTVRIDLADLQVQNPELDMGALDAFFLEFPADGLRGTVNISDLELAY